MSFSDTSSECEGYQISNIEDLEKGKKASHK